MSKLKTVTRYKSLSLKILNNFLGLVDVSARLVVSKDENGEEKRGFILQPTQSVYAKNRLDDRKGALVDELVVVDDD